MFFFSISKCIYNNKLCLYSTFQNLVIRCFTKPNKMVDNNEDCFNNENNYKQH